MTYEIERLRGCDFADAMDFLNMVFSQNSKPHFFERSLPKMCFPDDAHMGRHLAIKRDGRIRAMLGVYPLPMKVCGENFLFSTVGNVATHLDDRGSGMMTALLDEAERELVRIGADAARLGGYRSRYGRRGFEIAGTNISIRMLPRNVHDQYGTDVPALTFLEITPGSLVYRDIRALYNRRSFITTRESDLDFDLTLRAWEATPYAVYDGDAFVGYISAVKEGNAFAECAADTPERLRDICAAWITQRGTKELGITLAPWEDDVLRVMTAFCENYSVSTASHFRITSWAELTQAFLRLKNRMAPLPTGEFTLGIEGYGAIRMSVSGKGVFCERTDAPPELTLDRLASTRFLFGPQPPYTVAKVPSYVSLQLNAWLPLPLSWNGQDRV